MQGLTFFTTRNRN